MWSMGLLFNCISILENLKILNLGRNSRLIWWSFFCCLMNVLKRYFCLNMHYQVRQAEKSSFVSFFYLKMDEGPAVKLKWIIIICLWMRRILIVGSCLWFRVINSPERFVQYKVCSQCSSSLVTCICYVVHLVSTYKKFLGVEKH
jgi:hypothetical protein